MNKRKIILITLAVVAALAAYPVYRASAIWWENYQWNKKTKNFMAALEEPFRRDTYGGKTPEETWGLYVEAVKQRDIELASKYVDVNHQQKEKEFLERALKRDNLSRYIDEISNQLQKSNDVPEFLTATNDRAYYFYQYKDQDSGKTGISHVNFYPNPLTNVWKILY